MNIKVTVTGPLYVNENVLPNEMTEKEWQAFFKMLKTQIQHAQQLANFDGYLKGEK